LTSVQVCDIHAPEKYRYNEKGKVTEKWWRKATSLKPEGHDSRVAERYSLMTLLGRFAWKRFFVYDASVKHTEQMYL